MVVFEGGSTKKSDYRRFEIRESVSHDFAAMEEVLSRRMSRYASESALSPYERSRDQSFASRPSLIVIDGGKGQLSAGLRAVSDFQAQGVCVISLAKRIEEVFLPGRAEPLVLAQGDQGLELLQRVRDEAHRFAVEFHRGRRGRAMTHSVLDELPGIGPRRKRVLLNHFGSPERVLSASRQELESVSGLPGKLAREIYAHLHKAG
jgi:excinuclease ABC subunit C